MHIFPLLENAFLCFRCSKHLLEVVVESRRSDRFWICVSFAVWSKPLSPHPSSLTLTSVSITSNLF